MGVYIWTEPTATTVIDYDFTTTNPSDGLLGNGQACGYQWTSGSGIVTANLNSDDKGGRAAKQIGENLAGHIVTMDGTWYATIGDTWTTLGFGLWTTATTIARGGDGIEVTLGLQNDTGYNDLKCPRISNGTGKVVSSYASNTVGTGTRTIRLKSVFDFINWTVTTEVYRNGTLLNTYNYTLTSAEQTTVSSYIGSDDYYKAVFSRGYKTATLWMRSWKVTVE